MSQPVQQHRAEAPHSLALAVVTVSDTRTLDTDRGGSLCAELARAAGHRIERRDLVPDEPDMIRRLIEGCLATNMIDAILLTGGTGLSARDQTYETISDLLTKSLPGYGELFRMLSYAEIGPAAMLSRAVGGVVGQVVVLTMPGSPAAVQLAMEKVILPELGHLVREARR